MSRAVQDEGESRVSTASDGLSATSIAGAVRLRVMATVAMVAAIALAVVAVFIVQSVIAAEDNARLASNRYAQCERAIDELRNASEYLTAQSKLFVVSGEASYLNNYLDEILKKDSRGEAVRILEQELPGEAAVDELKEALQQSNALAQREEYAMRLTAEAVGLDNVSSQLRSIELSAHDKALSSDEKRSLATSMVIGEEYEREKDLIRGATESASDALVAGLSRTQATLDNRLDMLLMTLQIVVFIMLGVALVLGVGTFVLVMRPISSYVSFIKRNKELTPHGAHELQYLALAYNALYERIQRQTTSLKHAAEHDPLTGLLNRGAFDDILDERVEGTALVLIDVDHFKEVNDRYGHRVGDAVLKKVASAIRSTFRSSDFPCRIGGDEFAVVMAGMSCDMREVITGKVELLRAKLADDSDGLPSTTLSIGIAFTDSLPEGADVLHAADEALYAVKEAGRDGYAFYGDAASA